MRHRLRPWQGFAHGPLHISENLALKTTLVLTWIDTCVVQDAFRGKVTVRGVVLMQRMHGHPVRRRGCAPGQGIAKGIVALVGNPDPVHRAKHDWLPCAQKDNASRPQPELPVIGHRIISHHRADGRGGVHVEGGHTQAQGRRGCGH